MKKGNSFIAILLGIFVLILIFELLLTFKTISLPNFLKLPTPKTKAPASSPSGSLPFVMNCPAPVTPCSGKEMLKNNYYAGIGFTVKDGYPIFAAIPGTITFRDREAPKGSTFNLPDDIYILGSGKAKNYVAVYDFIGDKLGNNMIYNLSQGQAIATASAGNLIDFQDSKHINLIFRLQNTKGEIIPISPSDFQ